MRRLSFLRIVAFSAALLASGCASLGNVAELPRTDGYGLLAKPAPLPAEAQKQAYQQAQQSCSSHCVTPAGKLLGVADGVKAYSNCQSTCARSEFPLARSINGTAQRPPKRGDLLIYYPNPADPKWRHGHVAVVVNVDQQRGLVAVAEQNYNNQPWENPSHYARQIRLFEVGGRYRLVDVAENSVKNSMGGLISGWIYPASAP
jgi:hypothetical protein